MTNINSARTLYEHNKQEEGLMYQKEFADMVKEHKKEKYDQTVLEIAIKSLKVSRKSLFLNYCTVIITFITLLLTFYRN